MSTIQEQLYEQVRQAIAIQNLRTLHVFNSGRLTCKCLWCGRKRDEGFECPVDTTMREQIEDFVQENGPQWKSKLTELWMQGEPILQNVRNVLGPTGIHKISRKLLKGKKYV